MNVIQPNRAAHTFTQRLVADPATVFPLLCPVREADWIEGWKPPLVISSSGLAERDCVFVTDSGPDGAIWYITRHEREAGFVEMVKITPEVTACRLTIQLRAVEGGSEAEVTYLYTSLSEQGDAFIEGFTEEAYRGFMLDWEARLNHYLRHGKMMEGRRG